MRRPAAAVAIGMLSLLTGSIVAVAAPATANAAFRGPRPMAVISKLAPVHHSGMCAGALAPKGSVELSVRQLAAAYDFSPAATRDTGRHPTIALIEFARYDAHDLAVFERCTGSRATVRTEQVDGGPARGTGASAASGELEADADVEELAALLPDAHIVVVEGSEGSATDVLDTYSAAVAAGADVVSTSWGNCESVLSSGFVQSESVLFAHAAALGETVVAAAGDLGSADCYNGSGSTTGLAVDDPASQPDVVAVGGTSFAPHHQTVWNEGTSGGAGGGGVSTDWRVPAYQSRVAAAAEAVVPSGVCPSTFGTCRAVPDVSADAGTPVIVYCSATKLCSGWTASAGTSIAAPLWAAIFGLADSSAACRGVPLGFVDPALYGVAAGPSSARAFSAVTTGNNDLFGDASEFSAARGYNLASGLGAPIVGNGRDGRLLAQLCGAARPTPSASAVGAN